MGVSPLLLTILIITISFFLSETESASFEIVNNCTYTIWPAVVSTGTANQLSTTGFTLKSGASFNLTVPKSWSGRVWARTLCNESSTGNFSCFTADCGTGKVECGANQAIPPATLAEITLNGSDGLDFYDVALVDGFNLPMVVEPRGAGSSNCSSSGCSADLNSSCPKELKVAREASQGTVACMTPCAAFNNSRFCCSGEYSSPDKCEGTVYTDYFKQRCPQAYTYPYDGTPYTCASAKYSIVFCPSDNHTTYTSLNLKPGEILYVSKVETVYPTPPAPGTPTPAGGVPTVVAPESPRPAGGVPTVVTPETPRPAAGVPTPEVVTPETPRPAAGETPEVVTPETPRPAAGETPEVVIAETPRPPVKKKKNKRKKKISIIASSIAGIVIIILAVLACLWNRKRKRQQGIQNSSLESKDGRRFMYSELVKITNNFASPIGAGGFGKVYHGVLENNDQVAVKLLISASGSNEFQNEVKLLMRAHHRNVVSFTGYCNDRKTMALVFEYVANGNLQQHLTASDVDTGNILTWKERLQIAVDAAHGLDYLHNGCKPPIIHRDIKTSNILLTEKMQAKICDFGVSKLLSTETATHTMTDHVRGTRGYFDPEYFTTGMLNKKSDIYSFGIVLLELITGRKAIITDVEPEPFHICQWVKPMFQSDDIESILDSRIQAGTYNVSSAWKAVRIAMECVSSTSIERPDINVVYKELKECLEIEVPPEIAKVPEADESEDSSTSSSVSVHMASHTESDSFLVHMKPHTETVFGAAEFLT